MTKDVKEIMKRGREFIAAHLKECCVEELEWQNTAILRNGRMREAGEIFATVDGARSLAMVQSEIACQAMQALAAPSAAPSAANGAATCPACKGNDADMPCAYPSERVKGCVRDVRLSANVEDLPEPTYFGQGPDGSDLIGYTAEQLRAAVLAERASALPVDMVLHCPACGVQHIDAPDERSPDWANPPHRSHLCHGCGHIWRPADVPTNGVTEVQTKGKADSPIASPSAIRNGALEEAAKIADSVNNHDNPMTAGDVADAIRART